MSAKNLLLFKRDFAIARPLAEGVYLPLDAVAMRVMGELSLVIGRDATTAIILTHFDVLADAVGRAECDERYMHFAVADADIARLSPYGSVP